MITPRISFVMPTRDRDCMIKEAIESIINQTENCWELILVDDHSQPNDKTEEIAKSFKDERIRYFRLPDGNGVGIPAARNFGNILTAAPFIAVMDSDDICYPDRLALTIDAFEKKKADVVYGQVDIWYEDTGEVRLRDDDHAARPFNLHEFKSFDFIPHPTVAYRRDLALEFPYNSFFRKASDYDLLSRMFKYNSNFYYIESPLVKYRKHQNSTVSIGKDGFNYSKMVKISRSWIDS